jgi:hypothetical protein
VGGRLLDTRTARFELTATQDVPATDHNGDLRPVLLRMMNLPRNLDDLFHADPALASMRKTLAGQLQHHAPKRRSSIGGQGDFSEIPNE